MGRPRPVSPTGRDGAERIRVAGDESSQRPRPGEEPSSLGLNGRSPGRLRMAGAFQVLSVSDGSDRRHPFRGRLMDKGGNVAPTNVGEGR